MTPPAERDTGWLMILVAVGFVLAMMSLRLFR